MNQHFETIIDPDAIRVDNFRDTNYLICADCLDILKRIPDGCIDLVYIDPPFCTQSKRVRHSTNHNYSDSWAGGLQGYVEFLKPRLEQIHRVLKETGTFFVHLDYRTVHYIKVELDKIFGEDNFLNEIIWSYRTGGQSKKWFARKHQTILLYAKKTGQHKFRVIHSGKFRTDGLNYDAEGRPYKTTKKGRLYFNADGPALTDVWEIPFLSTVGLERTGYPDQKPLALIERIIEACSDQEDMVADFFAGSGTTLEAAKKLGRHWLGVEKNPEAVKIAEKRIQAKNQPANLQADCVYFKTLSNYAT